MDSRMLRLFTLLGILLLVFFTKHMRDTALIISSLAVGVLLHAKVLEWRFFQRRAIAKEAAVHGSLLHRMLMRGTFLYVILLVVTFWASFLFFVQASMLSDTKLFVYFAVAAIVGMFMPSKLKLAKQLKGEYHEVATRQAAFWVGGIAVVLLGAVAGLFVPDVNYQGIEKIEAFRKGWAEGLSHFDGVGKFPAGLFGGVSAFVLALMQNATHMIGDIGWRFLGWMVFLAWEAAFLWVLPASMLGAEAIAATRRRGESLLFASSGRKLAFVSFLFLNVALLKIVSSLPMPQIQKEAEHAFANAAGAVHLQHKMEGAEGPKKRVDLSRLNCILLEEDARNDAEKIVSDEEKKKVQEIMRSVDRMLNVAFGMAEGGVDQYLDWQYGFFTSMARMWWGITGQEEKIKNKFNELVWEKSGAKESLHILGASMGNMMPRDVSVAVQPYLAKMQACGVAMEKEVTGNFISDVEADLQNAFSLSSNDFAEIGTMVVSVVFAEALGEVVATLAGEIAAEAAAEGLSEAGVEIASEVLSVAGAEVAAQVVSWLGAEAAAEAAAAGTGLGVLALPVIHLAFTLFNEHSERPEAQAKLLAGLKLRKEVARKLVEKKVEVAVHRIYGGAVVVATERARKVSPVKLILSNTSI